MWQDDVILSCLGCISDVDANLSVQALKRRPNDENLKADLQEVQACLQPADSSTMRAIADQRFKSQVCYPSYDMFINEAAVSI